jgi:hypothetical protein
LSKDVANNITQKLVLGERNTTKNDVTLTKDDFKKAYELNNNNSFSVFRENSIQRSDKTGSKSKIFLDKITDPIIEKKMQSTGFEFGSKKFYSNQSNLSLMGRS